MVREAPRSTLTILRTPLTPPNARNLFASVLHNMLVLHRITVHETNLNSCWINRTHHWVSHGLVPQSQWQQDFRAFRTFSTFHYQLYNHNHILGLLIMLHAFGLCERQLNLIQFPFCYLWISPCYNYYSV
jgi:hypothetical protein